VIVHDDPYVTLQIPRDADARTIKASYFALVRKHPPETDPETFQKIRAAYELLSDPERRAEYDAERARSERNAPEINAVIEAADQCMRSGQFETARKMLLRLLDEQPGVHRARSILGFAWLREGEPEQAAAEFRRLVEAEPQDSDHRLHLAWALSEANRLPEALEAAQAAVRLAPASVAAAGTLGDVFARMGDEGEALDAWRDARGRVESRLDVLELHLRELRLLLSIDAAQARRAFLDLERDVLATGDVDLKRVASGRVASIAANLFAKGAYVPANSVLEWAARLAPVRTFEGAQPPQARVAYDRLPEAARKWIRDQGGDAPLHKGTFARGIARLLVGLLLAAGAYACVSEATSQIPWDGSDRFWYFCLSAATISCIWGGVSRTVRSAAYRGAGAWLLHPLWLMRRDGADLEAWSILRLTGVHVDHPQGTSRDPSVVRLHFGPHVLRVSARAREHAEGWAREVSAHRRRTLELLAGSLLQSEPDVGILPPELITSAARQPALWRRPVYRRRAAICAASLALTTAATMLAPRYAEATSWSKAQTLTDLRRHLVLFPGSKHEAEAIARFAAAGNEAVARAERRAGHELPYLRLALADGSAARGGFDIVHKGAPAPKGVQAALDAAAGSSAVRLRKALERLVGDELAKRDRSAAPAVLALRYALHPTNEVFRASGHADVPSYDLECAASLEVGGRSIPLASLTVAPAASYATSERVLRETPDALVRESLEAGHETCERAAMEALAGRPDLIETHTSALLAAATQRSAHHAHSR